MAAIFNIELQYRRLVEPILAQTAIRFETYYHQRRSCLFIVVDDKDAESMAVLLMKHRTTL